MKYFKFLKSLKVAANVLRLGVLAADLFVAPIAKAWTSYIVQI
jgi:hypothetical protein